MMQDEYEIQSDETNGNKVYPVVDLEIHAM